MASQMHDGDNHNLVRQDPEQNTEREYLGHFSLASALAKASSTSTRRTVPSSISRHLLRTSCRHASDSSGAPSASRLSTSLAARNARKGVGKSIASDMISSSSAFTIAVYPKHVPASILRPLFSQGRPPPGHAERAGDRTLFLLALPAAARHHHSRRRSRTRCWECKRPRWSASLWVVVARVGSGSALSMIIR